MGHDPQAVASAPKDVGIGAGRVCPRVTFGRVEPLPKEFTRLSQDLVQAVQEFLLRDANAEQAPAEAAQRYNQQRSG